MGDVVSEPQEVKDEPLASADLLSMGGERPLDRDAVLLTATSFTVLFCTVGLVAWGLPFYYDFMVRDFGWTRTQPA